MFYEIEDRLKRFSISEQIPVPVDVCRKLFDQPYDGIYGVLYVDKAKVQSAFDSWRAARVAKKLSA